MTRLARTLLRRAPQLGLPLLASALLACAPRGQAPQRPEVAELPAEPEAAAEAPVAEVAEVPEVGESAFVLVWFDAPLYRSPEDEAPLWAYDFGEAPREDRPGQVFVARHLESRGPWVKVGGVNRWIDGDRRPLHCIGSDIFDASAVDIAVWVQERDLAPVLVAPLDRRYEDGTSVALNPGAPILGERVWVDGYSLPVAPPPESVGLLYRPVEPRPRSRAETSLVAASTLVATLGGAHVPWSRPVWNYAERPLLSLTDEGDGGHHLIVERCGTLELGFEGEYEALPPGGVLGGMAGGSAQAGGSVAAGTPLLWPDGSPAGSVTEELWRADLLPGQGPMTCFAVGVGRELQAEGFRGDRAEVCVETSRIVAVER